MADVGTPGAVAAGGVVPPIPQIPMATLQPSSPRSVP